MESPVIVENRATFPIPDTNSVETGFPFDDTDYESSDHFQTRLNDIAQRHPEFADHLQFDGFPSWRRKRYGSGSSSDREDVRSHPRGQSSASFDTPETRRFGDHSFPSGFNRFPFTSHFDDFPGDLSEDKPPEVPRSQEKRGRKVNPNLPQHLSNTVDLGQKQAPVEENRSQRSMSAPPENRTTQSASHRLESDSPGADANMGLNSSKKKPQVPNNTPRKPVERVIPIHVEGRDEPLIPKNINTEPEKVFGTEHVSFPNRTPPSHTYQDQQYRTPPQNFPHHQQHTWQPQSQFASSPEQVFRQQQNIPVHKEQASTQQSAPPMRQTASPNQTQSPKTNTVPSTEPEQNITKDVPPSAKSLNDPLEKIKSIKNDVLELMQQVEKFTGTRKDKQYIYLDEMLTRNLLKLDNIETEGKENIRQARREAIKCIQKCINILEEHAQAKEKQNVMCADQETDAEKTESETQQESQKPKFRSEASIELKPFNDSLTMEDDKKEGCTKENLVEQGAGEPMETMPIALSQAEIVIPKTSVEKTSANKTEVNSPIGIQMEQETLHLHDQKSQDEKPEEVKSQEIKPQETQPLTEADKTSQSVPPAETNL